MGLRHGLFEMGAGGWHQCRGYLLSTHPPACLHARTPPAAACLRWQPSVLAAPTPLNRRHQPTEGAQEVVRGKRFIHPGICEGNIHYEGVGKEGRRGGKRSVLQKRSESVFLCSLFLLNCCSSLLFKGNLLRKCVV